MATPPRVNANPAPLAGAAKRVTATKPPKDRGGPTGGNVGAITITITGPRAAGKTTTAARLVALLRAFGHEAEYVGATREREAAIERMIAADEVGSWSGGDDQPRRFAVRDMD